MSDISRLSKDR